MMELAMSISLKDTSSFSSSFSAIRALLREKQM
jgi:hypothetical protein